ncbi:PCRF domain-containing protein, partial [Staphylococcus aureus]|uniref:PCRF domain-containing protein n=1 Tax=Staphylococcus aureus TaxID=1280 RepID=UPI0035C7FBC9
MINRMNEYTDVVNDSYKLRKYAKEQADLQKTVDVYRNYKAKKEELADIEERLSETDDKEEVEMLKEESNGMKDINIQDRKIKKVSKNKKRVDAQYKIKTNYGNIDRNVQFNFVKEDGM